MITGLDKALVAAIMAVIQLMELFWGLDLPITQDWLIALMVVIAPVLVWAFPNRR